MSKFDAPIDVARLIQQFQEDNEFYDMYGEALDWYGLNTDPDSVGKCERLLRFLWKLGVRI
jgi:hypothetical protein